MKTAALIVSAAHLDAAPWAVTGATASTAVRSVSAEIADTAVALEIHNVSLSFGGVKALAHVDLAVELGKIHAVIGPNGAGKSSLVNIISGIYGPDSGKVKIGADVFDHVPTTRPTRGGVRWKSSRSLISMRLRTGASACCPMACRSGSPLRERWFRNRE